VAVRGRRFYQNPPGLVLHAVPCCVQCSVAKPNIWVWAALASGPSLPCVWYCTHQGDTDHTRSDTAPARYREAICTRVHCMPLSVQTAISSSDIRRSLFHLVALLGSLSGFDAPPFRNTSLSLATFKACSLTAALTTNVGNTNLGSTCSTNVTWAWVSPS